MHPVVLHLGPLAIPSFGLLAAAGVFGALRLSERTATLLGLDGDAMWTAGLFTILAAFGTSRVLLLLTNLRGFLAAPLLLLTVPSLTLGGIALTIALTGVYLRWKHLPILSALDAWAAPGLLLWAALALGHLLEGSDPGMPATGWGMQPAGSYRQQPVALYATLLALGLAGVVLDRTQARPQRPGRLAAWALGGAGVAQFILSFLRAPFLWEATGWWVMLDPIQWAALAMVLAGATLWALGERRAATSQPETPGARPAQLEGGE